MKETDANPFTIDKTLLSDNTGINLTTEIINDNKNDMDINKNMEQQKKQIIESETVTCPDVLNGEIEKMSEINPTKKIERIILGVESVVAAIDQNDIAKETTDSFTVSAVEQKPVQSLTDATEVEAVETKISEDKGKCTLFLYDLIIFNFFFSFLHYYYFCSVIIIIIIMIKRNEKNILIINYL